MRHLLSIIMVVNPQIAVHYEVLALFMTNGRKIQQILEVAQELKDGGKLEQILNITIDLKDKLCPDDLEVHAAPSDQESPSTSTSNDDDEDRHDDGEGHDGDDDNIMPHF